MGETPSVQKKRSMRYLIRVPLRYRVYGQRTWSHGIIRNISDTGIQFESELSNLEIGSRFECQLLLPVFRHSSVESSLRFDAEVVRSTDDRAWAAHFLKARLRRTRRARSTDRQMNLWQESGG